MNFTEKRILGRTDLLVSRLGIASGYGISGNAIEKAFHEYGINYFYWSTPRKSGMRDGLRQLIKKYREKIVIVLQSYDHLGFMLNRSIQKGLKTLGTDYADIILLGWHNRPPSQKVIKKALALKESGITRFIGMSGHNRKLFGNMAKQTDQPVDIFMTRYNAAHRGAENEIFPNLSEQRRPGITIYTATCWGKLLKKKKMPVKEQPLSASDCYRFVLSNPHVDLCIMGPSNKHEMEKGLTAIEKGPLSDQEMERVRRIGNFVHG